MKELLFKDIENISSGDGGARLYVVLDPNDGSSEAVLEQRITKRVPITELDDLKKMYHELNQRSGRPVLTLEGLLGKLPDTKESQ